LKKGEDRRKEEKETEGKKEERKSCGLEQMGHNRNPQETRMLHRRNRLDLFSYPIYIVLLRRIMDFFLKQTNSQTTNHPDHIDFLTYENERFEM